MSVVVLSLLDTLSHLRFTAPEEDPTPIKQVLTVSRLETRFASLKTLSKLPQNYKKRAYAVNEEDIVSSDDKYLFFYITSYATFSLHAIRSVIYNNIRKDFFRGNLIIMHILITPVAIN